MTKVWILSSGEKYEGEHIDAVYAEWDDALEALKQLSAEEYDGEPVRKVIDEDSDIAIVQDGPFYSIIRPREVL